MCQFFLTLRQTSVTNKVLIVLIHKYEKSIFLSPLPSCFLQPVAKKPGYEITGTVSNSDLNGKYVYLYEYGVKDAAPLDSALVQNGSFALKGTQTLLPSVLSVFRKKWLNRCVSLPEKTLRSWQHSYLKTEN